MSRINWGPVLLVAQLRHSGRIDEDAQLLSKPVNLLTQLNQLVLGGWMEAQALFLIFIHSSFV